MHVTLFMATSVNGIIARPDFREDFLSRDNWDSFLACARRTGALIWGRRTHEKVRKYGPQYFEPMRGLAKVVVSSDAGLALEDGFDRAGSPREAIATLEAKGHSLATLSGGSILNTAFAKEGLIDALEILVEAVVVGNGIPVFAPEGFDLHLDLVDVQQVTPRIVRLRFDVKR